MIAQGFAFTVWQTQDFCSHTRRAADRVPQSDASRSQTREKFARTSRNLWLEAFITDIADILTSTAHI